ncbi:MAG: hypothetical protein FJY54_08975 [Betaproteobacteria bacterium]|nr:hypothetical protein [Betaproteobacteria bacterium]
MAARKDAPAPLASGTMLLEYRLESVLGTGGFGITYRAQDTNLDKSVAIKEYLPGDLALRALDGSVVPVNTDFAFDYKGGLERFLVEARTLAKFTHPNIVRVSRYFKAKGAAYMVMDYTEGESLNQMLRRGEQFEEARLKAILSPLLDGLEAVHSAGFLHRDIKPSNILVRTDGSPLLLDFGAARLAVRGAMHDIISVLTPGYAPVEQYISSGLQGPWSDVYSVAGVLYRVVTGENPPDALSRLRSDRVGKKLNAARVRFSAPFLAAIHWALALEEKRRPQNVAEWRSALLRDSESRAAHQPAPKSPGADPARKYVWVALGAVLFFVVFEAADLLNLRESGGPMRWPRKPLIAPDQALTHTGASPGVGRAATSGAVPAGPGVGMSREEMAQHLPHLADRFADIDANGDGRVSMDELQNFLRLQPAGAPAPRAGQ